jgi:hypothetical protein
VRLLVLFTRNIVEHSYNWNWVFNGYNWATKSGTIFVNRAEMLTNKIYVCIYDWISLTKFCLHVLLHLRIQTSYITQIYITEFALSRTENNLLYVTVTLTINLTFGYYSTWKIYPNKDGSVGITTRYGLDVQGIESRWVAKYVASIQTGPRAYPASYIMGTGHFTGDKAAGAWRWTPTPSNAEVKKRSRAISSWPVLRRTLL